MKIIINRTTTPEICDALKDRGFDIYFSTVNENLPHPVNTHPDMQLALFDGIAVCDSMLWDYYKTIFSHSSVMLQKGSTKTSGTYPDDVAYNIKVVENNVFHNFKYTDSVIRNHLGDKHLINVSQGYSGCSICKVSENAIITADAVIHSAAQEAGLKSLFISQGSVELPPFGYGFIGGASFYCKGKVYFFGDIRTHSDYEKINEFCLSCKSPIISLGEGRLFDYGSAFTFE